MYTKRSLFRPHSNKHINYPTASTTTTSLVLVAVNLIDVQLKILCRRHSCYRTDGCPGGQPPAEQREKRCSRQVSESLEVTSQQLTDYCLCLEGQQKYKSKKKKGRRQEEGLPVVSDTQSRFRWCPRYVLPFLLLRTHSRGRVTG